MVTLPVASPCLVSSGKGSSKAVRWSSEFRPLASLKVQPAKQHSALPSRSHVALHRLTHMWVSMFRQDKSNGQLPSLVTVGVVPLEPSNTPPKLTGLFVLNKPLHRQASLAADREALVLELAGESCSAPYVPIPKRFGFGPPDVGIKLGGGKGSPNFQRFS